MPKKLGSYFVGGLANAPESRSPGVGMRFGDRLPHNVGAKWVTCKSKLVICIELLDCDVFMD
jgi:hypothetical protein